MDKQTVWGFQTPRSDFRSIGSGFRPQGLSVLLYLISAWFIVKYIIFMEFSCMGGGVGKQEGQKTPY